jgi:hypothetical protein
MYPVINGPIIPIIMVSKSKGEECRLEAMSMKGLPGSDDNEDQQPCFMPNLFQFKDATKAIEKIT